MNIEAPVSVIVTVQGSLIILITIRGRDPQELMELLGSYPAKPPQSSVAWMR